MLRLSSFLTVTLRDYVDTRFRSIEESTKLANTALERRLDALNELRGVVADQAGKYAVREVLDQQLDEIRRLIDVNTDQLSVIRGSQTGSSRHRDVLDRWVLTMVAMVPGVISIVYVITHKP